MTGLSPGLEKQASVKVALAAAAIGALSAGMNKAGNAMRDFANVSTNIREGSVLRRKASTRRKARRRVRSVRKTLTGQIVGVYYVGKEPHGFSGAKLIRKAMRGQIGRARLR